MRDDYQLFLDTLTSMLSTLAVGPQRLDVSIRLTELPGMERPVESLHVTVRFAGADCIFNFGQSVLEANHYWLSVELQRPQHPTLFVKDYLAAQHLAGADSFSFRLSDHSRQEGVARQIGTVRSLLDVNLRPLLESGEWLTAPLDWEGYK